MAGWTGWQRPSWISVAIDWRPRLGVSAGGKFPSRLAAVRAESGGWREVPREPAALAACLACFPVSALPLGVSDLSRLRELWLNTLGSVGQLPAARLTDFLGPAGPRIRQLTKGWDPDPVRPAAAPARLAERMVFPWPLSGEVGLLAAARSLCETLWTRPALVGWTVGQPFLSGDLLEGGSWRWARRLRFPAGSAATLYAALPAGLSAQDRQGRSPRPAGELMDLTLTVSALSPQRGFQAGLEQAVGESRVRSVFVPGVGAAGAAGPGLAPAGTALAAGRRPAAAGSAGRGGGGVPAGAALAGGASAIARTGGWWRL